MPLIASLKTWINNEILTATDLNANFAELRTTTNAWAAFKDQAQTFSAAQTFGALATFQAGVTIAGGATVSSGGVAVTGASSFAGAVTVSSGGIAVTGNSTVTGTLNVTAGITGNGSGLTNLSAANLTGALPAISGAALTGLNATNITTGTLDEARITTLTASKLAGALPAISGAALTNLNGSNIATGTVAAARLPTTLTGGTTIPELQITQSTVAGIRFGAPPANAPAISFHADHVYGGAGAVVAPANYPSALGTHVQWRWIRVTDSAGNSLLIPASNFS